LRSRALFATIAGVAVAAGIGSWWLGHASREEPAAPEISPAALWAASFRDPAGTSHALGELQGRIVVLNFWATWCAPCREEMPAFERLHDRWKGRGVAFIGLSDDEPAKVDRFSRDFGIRYPLWVGGEEVGSLARRLGNRIGVLPFTVMIAPDGRVLSAKVGPYTEADLEAKLSAIGPKSS
jgi:thiol-disulfide isomerase/thioredoxin